MIYRYFLTVVFALIIITGKAGDSTKVVYKYSIMREIGPSAWRQTQEAFKRARQMNADAILIHMNTYGGLVDAADSIRTTILNCEIPVYVFIDNNAASAGALISIACDGIYMRPGGNIGAATVVTGEGQEAPDKYQAYMRSTMRSTAEAHGKITEVVEGDTLERWFRDPQVAEAMVDPRIKIPGVVDSGRVITFTASEAIKNHYCEGLAENVPEVLSKIGITDYKIEEYQPSVLESIIDFLINPVIQGLLIMLIIGGIYFELQTPGIGFPLAAAITGAVLYFAPLYLEGLAEHWEILIFVAGIILIGLEIFVIPGFGVAGISGIILMILGLSLSMVDNLVFELDEQGLANFAKALAIVTVSMVLAFVFSLFFSRGIILSKRVPGLALETIQEKEKGFVGVEMKPAELKGLTGTALTDLRPSGKVVVNDEVYDAIAIMGFIAKDSPVFVQRYEAGQLYVVKSDNV